MTCPSDAWSVRREHFFGVTGGLHTVGWEWFRDYLNAVLVVLEGSLIFCVIREIYWKSEGKGCGE